MLYGELPVQISTQSTWDSWSLELVQSCGEGAHWPVALPHNLPVVWGRTCMCGLEGNPECACPSHLRAPVTSGLQGLILTLPPLPCYLPLLSMVNCKKKGAPVPTQLPSLVPVAAPSSPKNSGDPMVPEVSAAEPEEAGTSAVASVLSKGQQGLGKRIDRRIVRFLLRACCILLVPASAWGPRSQKAPPHPTSPLPAHLGACQVRGPPTKLPESVHLLGIFVCFS